MYHHVHNYHFHIIGLDIVEEHYRKDSTSKNKDLYLCFIDYTKAEMSTRQDGAVVLCPVLQNRTGQVKNRGISKLDTMKTFVLSVLEVFLDDLYLTLQ